jgi:hypothetical protein
VHGRGEGGRLQDHAGQLAVALHHVSEEASVSGDKRQIKRCFSVQGSLSLHDATCMRARREGGGEENEGGREAGRGRERERKGAGAGGGGGGGKRTKKPFLKPI